MATVLLIRARNALARRLVLEYLGHTVFLAETPSQVKSLCGLAVVDIVVIGEDASQDDIPLRLVNELCKDVQVLRVCPSDTSKEGLIDQTDWVSPERVVTEIVTRCTLKSASEHSGG